MKVSENLRVLQEKVSVACQRSKRDPEEVKIIAVTKYVTTERALEALECGVTHLGENRDEGLLEKWNTLGDKPTWHFIGTLQTRKVKNIIDKVDYIHSLDRESLAKEINARAGDRTISCFVQVNASGEESKHGLTPEMVVPFIKELEKFPKIRVEGLMTMAPFTEDDTIIRQCFQTLKKLQLEIQHIDLPFAPCLELSMGMSNDFEIAIEEGATMIRIGTALVGE